MFGISRGTFQRIVVLVGLTLPLVACAAAPDKSPPRAPFGMAMPSPGGGESVRVESVATAMEPPAPSDRSGDDDEASGPQPPAQIAPAKAPPPPPPAPGPTPKADPATAAVVRNRDLIVYTARVNLAVYQVDQSLASVESIGRDMGGFLAKKGDREISIRVPRTKFQEALAAIDKVGDVLHRDIQAEDVTAEHVDLEIRIQTARAMQKRLADLLTRASVKEALEIEKEMHRVTEDLERFEGRLKLLRDKVAYATLTVVFEPKINGQHVARVTLPFTWLPQLGLPNLLTLTENR